MSVKVSFTATVPSGKTIRSNQVFPRTDLEAMAIPLTDADYLELMDRMMDYFDAELIKVAKKQG
jgi:hypothetical protein